MLARPSLSVDREARAQGRAPPRRGRLSQAEKDGLEIGADIPRYAELGWQSIQESDLERLKWWGVFFRKHTPGHFMMRIRIPNGISNAAQLRAIAAIAQRHGRGVANITTRQ